MRSLLRDARPWLVVVALILVALPLGAEDRAVCAVCGPREGSGFEPVKATATYKGKQYFFCSTKCKVDFLKNPEAFLITDAGKPAPAFRLKTFDGFVHRLGRRWFPVDLADPRTACSIRSA